MAKDKLMEIMPNMRMDSLNFICDYFGPFFSQIFIKLLQWHVVALKKRGKCTIRSPQWMPVIVFWRQNEKIRDISDCTIPLHRDIQTSFLTMAQILYWGILWNLEISNQSFNIVDVVPVNMEDLTGN
ncbi:probable DNA replication complex GINS protein PSF2 [Mangifera indica]|uniref:probable DNA replication complex GINS protein PSF2 n=1 Tax=Mangifera indica TaxID=29780 RepID=UPI001CF959D7|nr:probable DNA replication complex GINS protein PSF2 [Mangifera indica]